MRKHIWYMALMVISVVSGNVARLAAAPPAATVTLIKVAYLYNFTKFIEWPPEVLSDAHPSFALCMFGTDVFEGALPTMQGKSIKGKKVKIKYFAHVTDLDPEACHLLFISGSEREQGQKLVAMLKERPVLTVGDMEQFARLGGIINFITLRHRTRFAINVDAAQRAGLRIRSKLLKLAKIVKEER